MLNKLPSNFHSLKTNSLMHLKIKPFKKNPQEIERLCFPESTEQLQEIIIADFNAHDAQCLNKNICQAFFSL